MSNLDICTELRRAASFGDLVAIRKLVEQGVNVNIAHEEIPWINYPLAYAAEYNHIDTVKYLIDHGADVNAVAGTYYTPLISAVKGGHVAIVQHLVEHGASVYQGNCNRETPMHIASFYGHLDIVEYLVEKGAPIDDRDQPEWATPLMYAIIANRFSVVKYLISKGASVTRRGKHGQTVTDGCTNGEIRRYIYKKQLLSQFKKCWGL